MSLRAACLALAALCPVLYAPAAVADCAAALRALGYGPGDYRPLPELRPGAPLGAPATLRFDMAMYRFAAPRATDARSPDDHLAIGNYAVSDVAGLVFAPKAGSIVEMAPADGSAGRPLDTACLEDPSIVYAGMSWRLVQGDVIDATLTSRLDFGVGDVQAPVNGGVPCRSTNLHTHGLLVRPSRPADPTKGAYGDYVLDVTLANGARVGADDCASDASAAVANGHGHGVIATPMRYEIPIPGKPGENGLGPRQHPSGLFWYHPHPHGYSRAQVSGGTTGLVTIGDLSDYACLPDPLHPDASCRKVDPAGFRVRTVELKDAQISPAGPAGVWVLNAAYDSHACALVLAQGEVRNGECQGATTDSGDHAGLKWVVTVNGVQYPTIHASSGKGEIWRIANASPNFTYDLSIVPVTPMSAAGTDFQVLAVDGVSVDQESDAGGQRSHLLLMPGSRVEVLVKEPDGGGDYVLRNNLVSTGASDSADIWPVMDLMKVRWPTSHFAARTGHGEAALTEQPRRPLRVRAPSAPPPSTPGPEAQDGIPARCRYAAGDIRKIFMVHRTVPVSTADPTKTKEVFGLIAGVYRAADGYDHFYSEDGTQDVLSLSKVWARLTATAEGIAFGSNPFSTICATRGHSETWTIENWTGEDHNFHVHQSKFLVSLAIPTSASLAADPSGRSTATDALIRSFAQRDVSMIESGRAPPHHDSIPIPRGESVCDQRPDDGAEPCKSAKAQGAAECTGDPTIEGTGRFCVNPGRIGISISFDRDEQVGEFVYHCHILEHEDLGMMAKVQIVCPAGDRACGSSQRPHRM